MNEKSSASQMFTISKYWFLNYLRSKRLYVLLAITVVISLIFLVVIWKFVNAEYLTSNEYIENWAMFVAFLVTLAALFFGGDAISSEYGKKTGYFLFPNPIKRWSIFWGKFFASLLASLIALLLYWGIALGDTYMVKGSVGIEAYYSLGLSLLYLVTILAFTYMFSSFFRNAAVSITIVAILYFFVFGIVNSIAMFTGVEPWFSITYAASVIENILKNPYPPHIQQLHGNGMSITVFNAPLYMGIGIMIGYFLVSAVIGTLVITYRELK